MIPSGLEPESRASDQPLEPANAHLIQPRFYLRIAAGSRAPIAAADAHHRFFGKHKVDPRHACEEMHVAPVRGVPRRAEGDEQTALWLEGIAHLGKCAGRTGEVLHAVLAEDEVERPQAGRGNRRSEAQSAARV